MEDCMLSIFADFCFCFLTFFMMRLEMALEMALSYMLVFCRVTIALTFLISSISKAFDLKHFRRAIDAFGILEYKYISPTALFLLSSEVIIALCMILGGRLLLPGFFLAMVLLFLFCIALTSVLVRKISLSCNCLAQIINLSPVQTLLEI